MSRKKPPEKAGIDQKKLIELIVKAMANNPRQPLNYKQIAAKLRFTEKEEKQALTEARDNEVQSLHDYQIALARLRKAMGVLDPLARITDETK